MRCSCGCSAEKVRKGIFGKIKDFVYDKAGWQIPTPAPAGKNAASKLKILLIQSSTNYTENFSVDISTADYLFITVYHL